MNDAKIAGAAHPAAGFRPPITIIYIVGNTHSGTTLLNRVLGAHPEAINIGGTKNLQSFHAGLKKCSCGAARAEECPFWSRVGAEISERYGRALRDLHLEPGWSGFAADYVQFAHAVCTVSGARIIVDSSRDVVRLRHIRSVGGIDVIPVHIFKQPRAQHASYRRKGQGLGATIREYWRVNLKAVRHNRPDSPMIVVPYEAFCRDPARYVATIMAQAGSCMHRDQLERWGGADLHVLGGNRMKFAKSSEIRLDENWQALPLMEAVALDLTCLPLALAMQWKARGAASAPA